MDTNLELSKSEVVEKSHDTTEVSPQKELESIQDMLDALDQDSLTDILFNILERRIKRDIVHGQK